MFKIQCSTSNTQNYSSVNTVPLSKQRMFPNKKMDLTLHFVTLLIVFVINLHSCFVECALLLTRVDSVFVCACKYVCVHDILPFLAGVCVELFPDVIQRDRWGFHLAFTLSQVAGSSHCLSLTVLGIYTFVTLKTQMRRRIHITDFYCFIVS